jgi:hypothetical protein
MAELPVVVGAAKESWTAFGNKAADAVPGAPGATAVTGGFVVPLLPLVAGAGVLAAGVAVPLAPPPPPQPASPSALITAVVPMTVLIGALCNICGLLRVRGAVAVCHALA